MLPKIWIIDSYSLMILLGLVACFFLYILYAKKYKINPEFTIDLLICATISVVIGLGSAAAFQYVYNLIGNKNATFGAMTFYGGLIGGIIAFLLIYKYWIKKIYPTTYRVISYKFRIKELYL